MVLMCLLRSLVHGNIVWVCPFYLKMPFLGRGDIMHGERLVTSEYKNMERINEKKRVDLVLEKSLLLGVLFSIQATLI